MWRAVGVAEGALILGALLAGAVWAASMDTREGPAASQTIVTASVVGDTSGHASRTVYIVGSEAEAAILRDAIDAGNNIRHTLGLDLVLEEVVVAASIEDGRRIEKALLEGNLILASFKVEDRVVNLVV